MCGIFAYLGDKSNAGEIVLEGLKSLEYRGYDSWGIALKKSGGGVFAEKKIGKIGQAKLPKIDSHAAIGHTRWATHGGVLKKNSHPHMDCQREIIIVHNGIVENFENLKKNLKKHKFRSDTDSEVIAHLIEDEIKKNRDLKKSAVKVFKRLEGLNALIVFYPKREQFVAVKNGSPLVFGVNKKTHEYFLASDPSALSSHVDNVYFLEDNKVLFIDKNQSFKKLKFIKLHDQKEDLDLGKYPDFMTKEIHEQPKVLTNTLRTQKKNILNLSKKIGQAYGTYLIGCGTAYYACLAGTYLFSKIAKKHTNASVASEFSFLVDFLKKKSLVIALSQSGETIDIISSVKKAKEKKAKIFALTNVLGSTLYRMADYKMLLNAGPEKCVLATKSFTSKIAILILLSYALKKDYREGERQIKKAIKEIRKIINNGSKLNKLANKIKNAQHIYILGRGLSYPTALESALKIKEVSYIHAEGFPAGELKHGVIALVEKGTPIIVYNPEDETYEDTLSSAYEVKARGAYIIGVSSRPNAVYDFFIKVDNCFEATIIPNVVIAQLLGYNLAQSKNYDPDKPRNLAKSVTVK